MMTNLYLMLGNTIYMIYLMFPFINFRCKSTAFFWIHQIFSQKSWLFMVRWEFLVTSQPHWDVG